MATIMYFLLQNISQTFFVEYRSHNIYIIFLGESNKSLYMVTNQYLISSISNLNKNKGLFCFNDLFLIQ